MIIAINEYACLSFHYLIFTNFQNMSMLSNVSRMCLDIFCLISDNFGTCRLNIKTYGRKGAKMHKILALTAFFTLFCSVSAQDECTTNNLCTSDFCDTTCAPQVYQCYHKEALKNQFHYYVILLPGLRLALRRGM